MWADGPAMTTQWGETDRLRVLQDYQILDSAPEPAFDDIVALAAELFDVPISAVSLVDADRQWFKASTGLDVAQTPRDISFCTHAMWSDGLFVVPDASQDPRFLDNPLVTGELGIRFYAGAPLRAADGSPLGTLCVIDTKPREGVTPREERVLRILAAQAMAQIELRGAVAREREREKWFRAIADSMPQMVWSTLPNGFHDYYNHRWYEFTGAPEGSTDGEGWNGMFHPDDRDRAWAVWRSCLASGSPYQIEYRLRHHSGEYRWVLGRALPVRDGDGNITRWFGTCTDIHETKQTAEQNELLSRELSHRIKNIFSVVGGLISLGARSFPEAKSYAAALTDRVLALGRAHDFIRPQGGNASAPRTLRRLLADLFRPYDLAGDRIAVGGDDLTIDERAATALALVFHELATNAAKYGALSVTGGHVTVTSHVEDGKACITWRERDGPRIDEAPTTSGFGSTLVRLSFEGQFGGTIEREWAPEGLVVTLCAPVSAMGRRVLEPA